MPKQQPTELDLLAVMQSRLGIKEIPGPEHNEIIVSWWAEVGWGGIKDDETAWCSICLCSAAKEAGLPMPPHDVRPLARGWLKWGVPAEPQPGAVGVWPRGTSDWQGHCAVVERVLPNGKVQCIGGNQGNAVTRRVFNIDDALGFRLPLVPTVEALREAGSKEVKTADRIEKTGIVGTVGSIAVAVTKELNSAAESIDITSLPTQLSIGEAILRGIENVWRLVAGNPWLAGVVVVGLGAILAARAIKKHRVERAKAGVPLSVELMADP